MITKEVVFMSREQIKARLDKEFDWFLNNQTQLVQMYSEKFVVVKGFKVIGSYDSYAEAIDKTLKTEKLGTFIVQRCSVNPANYVSVVHSGVFL